MSGRVVTWRCAADEDLRGALTDPIEAWLRCGPTMPRHTIVAGRSLVDGGRLVSPRVDEMLVTHRRISARIQHL
jgi:hypothetical protein